MELKRLKNIAYVLVCIAVVLIVLFTALTVLERGQGDTLQKISITPNFNNNDEAGTIEGNYVGIMGKDIRVHMHLKIQGELIYGYYYYDIFQKVLILKGSVDRGGNYKIMEYDEKENQTGIFSGQFSEDYTSMFGHWSDQNIKKDFSYTLKKMKENEKIVDYMYQEDPSLGLRSKEK